MSNDQIVVSHPSSSNELKNDGPIEASESSMGDHSLRQRLAASTAHTAKNAASAVKASAVKTKETAKHAAVKTKETAKFAAIKTKETAVKVSHKTSEVVETNVFCTPLKWMVHFDTTWPRTHALLFGVVLPLWVLIFMSMGFGCLLTQYESPPEVAANDAIMAARAEIDYFNQTAAQLRMASTQCIEDWADDAEENDIILTFVNNTQDWEVELNRTLLVEGLRGCSSDYVEKLKSAKEFISDNSLAYESLSFNWNRCWDHEKFGSGLIFHPSHNMIVATRPEQQEAYFAQEWERVQQELYELYLPENPTPDDVYEAFQQSVAEATGEDACVDNNGGTAWFFFTIMTTVGYGNQAPGTFEGRAVVAFAGLFSLILFAGVLGLTGYIILSIFDDWVGRVKYSAWLSNPGVGVVLWGSLWILYAFFVVGVDIDNWWEARLPDYAEEVDIADSFWFAFITMSTIGLGDYYLQPEAIFASDTLKYSVVMMIGFVFLSTFFGKLAESLAWFLPKGRQRTLEARLAATRVLACWGSVPQSTNEERENKTSAVDQDSISPEDRALMERIEHLEKLLVPEDEPVVEENPNAVVEDDSDHSNKPVEDNVDEDLSNKDATTNPEATTAKPTTLQLLQREEVVLRALLDATVAQRERREASALTKSTDDSNVAVTTDLLLTGEY